MPDKFTLLLVSKCDRFNLASIETFRKISIGVFSQKRPDSHSFESISCSESSPDRFFNALTADFINANSVMSGKTKAKLPRFVCVDILSLTWKILQMNFTSDEYPSDRAYIQSLG